MQVIQKKIKDFYEERKHWIKEYLGVFILDFLGKGAGYFLLPFYLKYMLQKDFGIYTYIIYIVTVFSSVLTLGINAAMSKLYFDYPEQRGTYLFSISIFLLGFLFCIFSLFLITGLDVLLMNKLVSDHTFDYYRIRYALFGYVFFLIISIQLNVYYLIASQIKVFQIYNLIRILGMSVLVLWFLSHTNENSYITRINSEVIISFLVFIPLLYKYSKTFSYSYNWEMVKKTLVLGLPIAGSSVFAIIYTLSDKYFLQAYESIDKLAIYNLALFLATPIGILLSTFNLIWVPIFFKEKQISINLLEIIYLLHISLQL
jgi:O-antigen/teichoic acid export membrane protein